MEIKFDVNITSGVLYDYLMHHSYSTLSAIIGNVVGALLLIAALAYRSIPFGLAAVVILLYLPWTLFLRAKQQKLTNPAFKQPLHYRLTDEGVEVSQGEEVQMQKWDEMYKAVSSPKSIMLYTSRVNACIFPRKDLGEDVSKVIEIISINMPPKKVKIRGWL